MGLYGCLIHGEFCLLSSFDPSVSLLVPMRKLLIVEWIENKKSVHHTIFVKKRVANPNWNRFLMSSVY